MAEAAYLENPFDLLKASDFSDEQILNYWVDIAGPHGLMGFLKPRSITPMLLLGGKGSGKTHLMRFCSAPVQAARVGTLWSALEKERYLGIYVRAEGLNSHKFADKGQPNEVWDGVFSNYMELWIASNLLSAVSTLVSERPTGFDAQKFLEEVRGLFDVDIGSGASSLDSLVHYLRESRRHIDFVVNNSAITRDISGISIEFSLGRLIYGLPTALAKSIDGFADTTVVYLIDEVENFTERQQRFLNTLIRYRRGNATIKLGARLYGIRTSDTLGSGEPIKRDAEYEKVELDRYLRENQTQYESLVRRLVEKRLHSTAWLTPKVETDRLEQHFDELDTSDHWRAATLRAVEGYDSTGKERPYLRGLRRRLSDAYGLGDAATTDLVAPLRVPSNPLLEKANTFIFYRRWPKAVGSVAKTAGEIGDECRRYMAQKNDAPVYRQIIDHFASDLLAQLYRDCGRKVPYAGFSTIVTLSQGIPRNLLNILRNIFRRAAFAGEKPFVSGKISVEAQSDGIRDSAAWFWEDAQPDGNASEVREAVEALAILFRTIRFSERPAECDLCAFSVDSEALTKDAKRVLDMAENWSFVVRVSGRASSRNSERLDAKYQFGPMLAARWDLSEHRRGYIELTPELAGAIFDPGKREVLPDVFRRRVEGMLAPFSSRVGDQESLF